VAESFLTPVRATFLPSSRATLIVWSSSIDWPLCMERCTIGKELPVSKVLALTRQLMMLYVYEAPSITPQSPGLSFLAEHTNNTLTVSQGLTEDKVLSVSKLATLQ